jgi:DUF4097 and DUF4098 domain-containing protein YvlB
MTRTACSIAIAVCLIPAPAAANAAREEVTRTIERTLAVTGAPVLAVIHSTAGNLRIRTHARSEVRFVALVRVSSDSRERAVEFMNTITVDVIDTPARLTVETKHAAMGRRYRNVGFAVDLEVTMPERMPLDANSRFGAMSVTGVGAGATLRSSNGRLTVTDGRGRIYLENRFGPIDASRLTGNITIVSDNGAVNADTIYGSLTATNRFGPVTLRGVEHAVSVENSNGAITVQDVGGGAVLITRFGPVDAQMVRGGLRVENDNGSIRAIDVDGETNLTTRFGLIVAGGIRGPVVAGNNNGGIRVVGATGSIRATTEFGAVTVRDVDGPVDIRSSNGNIDVDVAPKSAPCHDVTLSGRFGAIGVYVSGGGYNVHASTKFGRVQSDVPILMTGTIKPRGQESSVTGTIGGGGCALRLTGDNGNISIRRSPGPAVSLDIPGGRQPRPSRPPR